MKILRYENIDWTDYFAKGKKELKTRLESDPEMWKSWTNSGKRYTLHSKIHMFDGRFKECKNARSGMVTDYMDTQISADKVGVLRKIFATNFYQGHFDCTTQHFIVDNLKKKVVCFLSVCM